MKIIQPPMARPPVQVRGLETSVLTPLGGVRRILFNSVPPAPPEPPPPAGSAGSSDVGPVTGDSWFPTGRSRRRFHWYGLPGIQFEETRREYRPIVTGHTPANWCVATRWSWLRDT